MTMTPQLTADRTPFAQHFRALRGRAPEPSWMTRLRETAFERFAQVGFPTIDEEDWKYTNIAPIARGDFAPAVESSTETNADVLGDFGYAEAAGSQLVFVDGLYRPALSLLEGLPPGVVVTNLTDALAAGPHEAQAREQFGRLADMGARSLTALNTALFAGGAFLLLPRGLRVETPIHLLFLSGSGTASSPRVLVLAGEGAEATIIESYRAAGEAGAPYWANAVTEVFLAANARLKYYRVQREQETSFHTAATHARLARHASFETTAVNLGAQLFRHDVSVALEEEGAECQVDGLYLVGDGQHSDTHSLIDHRVPHCASRQLYKGILDGKSRAVFNGIIYVRPGARQTDAIQTNKNLLLSREARVETKPQLEIYNDDVKCAHGATVGQLEDEELFYLLSRGLHEETARNLLTYGFAEEVVEKIGVESIRAQLDEAILGRLHARL